MFNDLAHRANGAGKDTGSSTPSGGAATACRRKISSFPGKTAPRLGPWQRELLRTMRHIANTSTGEPVQGHERGHRDLRAGRIMNRLHSAGRTLRRQLPSDSGDPTPMWSLSLIRRPAFFRLECVCARLCDDAGHRTHRHRPDDEDRSGFPNRGRRRRDGCAAPGVGQLPRRKLHQPIPVAEADAKLPAAVSVCTTIRNSRRHPGRCDPRCARLSPHPPRTRQAI